MSNTVETMIYRSWQKVMVGFRQVYQIIYQVIK